MSSSYADNDNWTTTTRRRQKEFGRSRRHFGRATTAQLAVHLPLLENALLRSLVQPISLCPRAIDMNELNFGMSRCMIWTLYYQREEGQRLEATTTKRCSSAGECRNAIPNCGRHRQPTTEQHARTASWMRTDQAKGSNKGTSESSKRMITLHTRVLPERALIYTQRQSTKRHNHGVVTKMR